MIYQNWAIEKEMAQNDLEESIDEFYVVISRVILLMISMKIGGMVLM